MKKLLAGIGFMITGALLVLAASVASSVLVASLDGWSTELGMFGTAMTESGLIAAQVFGIIFIIVGVIMALFGALKKTDSKKDETDKVGEEL